MKKTVELTETEIEFLFSLVLERKNEGSYYGNKEHYYKRTLSVLDKLERAYSNEKATS